MWRPLQNLHSRWYRRAFWTVKEETEKKSVRTIGHPLTLRELGALACLLETSLLPFNNTGVSRQQTFWSQRNLVGSADLNQRTGDTKANCLGLAWQSTSMNFYEDVIVVLKPESRQGDLTVLHPHWVSLQILLHIFWKTSAKYSESNKHLQLNQLIWLKLCFPFTLIHVLYEPARQKSG